MIKCTIVLGFRNYFTNIIGGTSQFGYYFVKMAEFNGIKGSHYTESVYFIHVRMALLVLMLDRICSNF